MNSVKERAEKRKTKKPKKISATYLYNSGLYYLQRFPASEGHFKKVLTTKVKRSCYYHKDQSYEECINLVKETVIKFKSLGLLNDEEYTKAMIHSLRQKGKSIKFIANKLKEKSVTGELIQKHLYENESYNSKSAELYAALILLRKKRKGAFKTSQTNNDNYEKDLAFLARNGFSYDTAQKALLTKYEEALELIHQYSY
jgi:regulatory protein